MRTAARIRCGGQTMVHQVFPNAVPFQTRTDEHFTDLGAPVCETNPVKTQQFIAGKADGDYVLHDRRFGNGQLIPKLLLHLCGVTPGRLGGTR